MAIVSSAHIKAQMVDGSWYVVERHYDSYGAEYTQTFFASANANIDDLVSQHASTLEGSLALAEIDEELSNG